MSYSKLILSIKSRLLDCSENPEQDAKTLLHFITGLAFSQLLLTKTLVLTNQQHSELEEAIALLNDGYPISYLIEETEFYRLPIKVNSSVLIPRPETEQLVDLALNIIKQRLSSSSIKKAQVMEIGVGSGCIMTAILKNCYDKIESYTGIELSSKATLLANSNLNKNLANLPTREPNTLSQKGVFSLFSMDFSYLLNTPKSLYADLDLLISNPPYIPMNNKLANIQRSVLRYEPNVALFGGKDGLYFYKLIRNFCQKMETRPYLALEIAPNIALEVENLFRSIYEYVDVIDDVYGRKRFLFAGEKPL